MKGFGSAAYDAIFKRMKKQARLYPNYIFALTMGTGKTILMATIVATEFAMAQEYAEPEAPFVQNALIFAPGKN